MARPFAPRGMFQPKRSGMPSFYQSPASYGLTVGNANLPEYTFAPTAMGINSGSSQSVGGGGATSNRSPGLNPGAVAATSSSSRSTNTGAPAASTTTAFTSPISSSPYNHYHVNSHNQHLQQQQPHHQQLQLPLHGLPSSSDSSSYHQQQQPQNHQHLHNYSAAYDQGPYNIKMEAPSDLAQQEAAARDYQPELEVGSFNQSIVHSFIYSTLCICSFPESRCNLSLELFLAPLLHRLLLLLVAAFLFLLHHALPILHRIQITHTTGQLTQAFFH